MLCLDHMGPASAQSFPGQPLVDASPTPAQASPVERARQELDEGRRGKGDIFGAFRPVTGEACTHPSAGRTMAHGVEFLEPGDAWVPPEAEPV